AAAAGYGLDLRRLVVADDPGEHFAEVVTAMASVCPVVLAAAPAGMPPRSLDRLAAHLRRAGTVLMALITSCGVSCSRVWESPRTTDG
ncbi:hypothetical protein ABZ885_33280, partial [Kitasatospora sp. NPDC047058]